MDALIGEVAAARVRRPTYYYYYSGGTKLFTSLQLFCKHTLRKTYVRTNFSQSRWPLFWLWKMHYFFYAGANNDFHLTHPE